MLQSVTRFCNWLADTPLSIWIQSTDWVIPAVQSIHIMAIAMVISSVLMLNLRLLGALRPLYSPAAAVRRFSPWIWSGLVVLLATGSILVTAEPGRDLLNLVFVAKMTRVLIAVVVTAAHQTMLSRGAAGLELAQVSGSVRVGAILSCVVWIAIVACGRWIAYAPHG
jgi:hypothetical protein